MSPRGLVLCVTLLVAARADADRICVKSDAARERLSAEQQSMVRQVFEAVLLTAEQQVGNPCDETWTLSHVRLGESLHVLLVTPRGSFTATSPAFETLGMTYEGLVWRVLATQRRASSAAQPIAANDTLAVDVEKPAVVAAEPKRGGVYLRIGYGLAPPMTGEVESRTGPTIGGGYRLLTGDWMVDFSVMNTHGWRGEMDYEYNFLSFGRLTAAITGLEEPTSTWYAGGGISFGESAVRVIEMTMFGEATRVFTSYSIQFEGVLGFEMMRDRAVRFFFEAWLTAPLSSVEAQRWNMTLNEYETATHWAPTLNFSTGIGF